MIVPLLSIGYHKQLILNKVLERTKNNATRVCRRIIELSAKKDQSQYKTKKLKNSHLVFRGGAFFSRRQQIF